MPNVEAELGYLYKLLSLALSYPTGERVAALRGMAVRAGEIFHGPPLREIGRILDALPPANDAAALEALGAEYIRTFDTGRLVCPCETELLAGKMSVKTNRLADIAGFHAAFGFKGGEGRGGEAPDHVAVSLEFLAFLSLKVVRAREEGDPGRVAVVADARRAFLADHAGPFGLHFAAMALRREVHPLHAAAASLLAAAIEFDARSGKLKLRPFAGTHAPEPPAEDDGACGFGRPGGRGATTAAAVEAR